MKKVIVIGCPGAGKSTFSRALRDKVGLPLHYLDMLWHMPDRTNIPREEFDARLAEILAGDAWIVDGNYHRTLEMRLRACDTVFFFDLPTEVCIAGATARIGVKREDMPWVEETLDGDFMAWIAAFRTEQLPRMKALLDAYRDRVRVITFRTRDEADEYLKKLSQGDIS